MAYFFDTLPLHRSPVEGEALTGFLTRLGEDNGVRSCIDLSLMIFPSRERRYAGKLADYPPVSFEDLPAVANCSEELFRRTTFFHLGHLFGRSTSPQPLSKFLRGSIASTLRYCPDCLKSNPVYLLLWRFLSLAGCPEHGARLLDTCGHCGHPIPLLASPLRIARCPTCHGDLTLCEAEPIAASDVEIATSTALDLSLILSPLPEGIDNRVLLKRAGHHFAIMRKELRAPQYELAARTGVRPNRIVGIECGAPAREGTSLADYAHYASYFGVALRDLFGAQDGTWGSLQLSDTRRGAPADESEPGNLSEQELRQRPQTPVGVNEVLEMESGDILQQMSMAGHVEHHLGVLEDSSRTSRGRSVEQLQLDVEQALQSLKSQGQNITQSAICRILKTAPWELRRHPPIDSLVRREVHAYRRGQRTQRALERENRLLERVTQAIGELSSEGKMVNLLTIAERLAVHVKALKSSPAVRALLAPPKRPARQTTTVDHEQQESQLLERVRAAITDLCRDQRKVTLTVIAKIAGSSPFLLNKYPTVRAELDGFVKRPRRGHVKRPPDSETLVTGTIRVIAELESTGRSLSQDSVARELGLSKSRLRGNEEILTLIKDAQRRRSNQRTLERQQKEQEIADRVYRIRDELLSQGKLVSKRAIAMRLGVPTWGLRRPPCLRRAVNEVIAERVASVDKEVAGRERILIRQTRQLLQEAAARGHAIDQRTLCGALRISTGDLPRYPRLKALLAQAWQERRLAQQARRSLREEQLIEAIREAVRAIESQNLPLTVDAVAGMAGMTPRGLAYYPRVKALLKSIVDRARKSKERLRTMREGTLVRRAQDVIMLWKGTGRRLTRRGIGKAIGASRREMLEMEKLRFLVETAIAAEQSKRSAS